MTEWADPPGANEVPGLRDEAGAGQEALPQASSAYRLARPYAEQGETREHEAARDGVERDTPPDGSATEARQDHSAGDLLREAPLDPVQDNAGPEKG